MSQHEAVYKHFMRNFEDYAEKFLYIRPKSGDITPLKLNAAQRHIHAKLEEQKARTGKVRALILKGRQQGCSTYVAARFYHQATHRMGARVFILTHELGATENLFEMVERYHENNHPLMKPSTGASNAKELYFDKIDSGYKVGTAGNKATGRSATIQLFHGSEVAFWPNAADHAAGILQAVPNEKNTEIILESTANGIGNLFYNMAQSALRGEGEYQLIFVPWFWQEEYKLDCPEDFALTPEEAEYKALYGLSNEQMAWRRLKIKELQSVDKFAQEYPAHPQEAFESSGEESFIDREVVKRARKCDTANVPKSAPLLIGVDPARFGDDRTAIVHRVGRACTKVESFHKLDTMEVVGRVILEIQKYKPAKVFIDVCGLGAGIVDRLKELGHGGTIMAVNGGEKALESEKYSNKRAEMWATMKEWLEDAPCKIPDSEALHGDLTGLRYSYDSNSRLKLEKKEDAKKRGLPSPDIADALALTFAYPVGARVGSATKPLQANMEWGVF